MVPKPNNLHSGYTGLVPEARGEEQSKSGSVTSALSSPYLLVSVFYSTHTVLRKSWIKFPICMLIFPYLSISTSSWLSSLIMWQRDSDVGLGQWLAVSEISMISNLLWLLFHCNKWMYIWLHYLMSNTRCWGILTAYLLGPHPLPFMARLEGAHGDRRLTW